MTCRKCARAISRTTRLHAGRVAGGDRDHRHSGVPCCCPRSRRRARPHGGCSAATTSSRSGSACTTTPTLTSVCRAQLWVGDRDNPRPSPESRPPMMMTASVGHAPFSRSSSKAHSMIASVRMGCRACSNNGAKRTRPRLGPGPRRHSGSTSARRRSCRRSFRRLGVRPATRTVRCRCTERGGSGTPQMTTRSAGGSCNGDNGPLHKWAEAPGNRRFGRYFRRTQQYGDGRRIVLCQLEQHASNGLAGMDRRDEGRRADPHQRPHHGPHQLRLSHEGTGPLG